MKNQFDHIEDYVLSNLSLDDKLAFEVAMASDKKLTDAVEEYHFAQMIGEAVLEEELRSAIESELDGGVDLELGSEFVPKVNQGFINKMWWVVAACMILLSIAFYLYNTKNSNQTNKKVLYADVYIEPVWPINRGGDTTNYLSNAIIIALSGDYINGIQQIKDTHSNKITSENKMWVAELFAKNKQADSTLVYLPKNIKNHKLRDRVLYLEIISYYHLNNIKRVNYLISNIPNDTDSTYKIIYSKLGS